MKPRVPTRAQSLGELLPRLLDDLGLDDASLQVQLLRLWGEAVGPELAPHCRPQGLRGGEILAHVRDSAWMQRISLEQPRILARLETRLGTAAPRSMRLRIGPIEA